MAIIGPTREAEAPAPRSVLGEWREAGSCLDYQTWVIDLPDQIPAGRHAEMACRLRALGRLDQELLGVAYVRGDWGVLIVPPVGFPEIKIRIHHHVGEKRSKAILTSIRRIVDRALTATDPPKENDDHG